MKNSFETLRLRINKLSFEDADFIIQLLNTSDWLKYIGDRNVRTKNDANSFIERAQNNPNIQIWTIIDKENSDPIGILSLIKREALDSPDFGFALLPAYYKKGYALEASAKLLAIIQSDFENQPLLAITLEENSSSISLLNKLGFVFEKMIQLNDEKLMLYSKIF